MGEETHISRRTQQKAFLKYMGKALVTIVAIALIMAVFVGKGVLYSLEMSGLDPLLRWSAFKDPDIRVVEITDEDYSKFFKETSPLDRKDLRAVILKIANAKPKLLVIDLDVTPTKDERDHNVTPLPVQVQNDVPGTLIIWPQTTARPHLYGSEIELPLPPAAIPSTHFGVPLFPRERDGMVRAYMRYVPVIYKNRPTSWPSLAWQAFRGGTASEKPRTEEEEPDLLYFNFGSDRYAFGHTDIESIMQRDNAELASNLGGKTVILGGNYAAARDEYFTPAGPMAGVDLVAYAMETEIRGGGMRELQKIADFFVDILLGSFLAVVGYVIASNWLRIAASVLLGLTLPFIGSYLVFHSWNLWLSFVPVILGALVHIGWDIASERGQEKNEEIEELKKELKELKSRAPAKAAEEPSSDSVQPSTVAPQ
jgi:CHASE2 domain-containing sensor protein